MHKPYKKPVAKRIDYKYQEQVKAQSIGCNGWIYTNLNDKEFCSDYRLNTELKTLSSVDPCMHVTESIKG